MRSSLSPYISAVSQNVQPESNAASNTYSTGSVVEHGWNDYHSRDLEPLLVTPPIAVRDAQSHPAKSNRGDSRVADLALNADSLHGSGEFPSFRRGDCLYTVPKMRHETFRIDCLRRSGAALTKKEPALDAA